MRNRRTSQSPEFPLYNCMEKLASWIRRDHRHKSENSGISNSTSFSTAKLTRGKNLNNVMAVAFLPEWPIKSDLFNDVEKHIRHITGSMGREMVKAILGILKRQCITCQRNVGLRRTSCVDVCGATWDLSWNCNSVTLGWGIGGLSLRYFLTYVHSR